ncbi:uncharacterized protein CELE_C02F4.4 [Caenorhabditis elegans]|uniref:Uncharacterized protein n=1 Tax=Caenorhabditis elegans TaxID=6239 RepID=Q93185_CAEEL|nr:Uncharacterized protein CELE_C02F4.4 [Caenorhabditis elegans]CAB02720.1 Uncharacterized protein CELE_C02F4.4 [Caenorhabditis elegans]|eukprot:NP_501941.1 Uncharacterized protein CELE_C02F4.4 [Caenorhabditis elegans]
MKSLIFLTLLVVTIHCLTPPEGLRRAKQVGNGNGEPTGVEPPPNLQLRSRMMAAMNSHTQPIAAEKANIFNQPLILTKNKKMSKPVAKAIITQAITASTEIPVGKEEKVTSPTTSLSPEDIRKKFTSVGDEKVNLNIRPVLKTNFVDANGKVVRDVVSVPIRVSDGQINSIPKNAKKATSSSAVVETEKNVNVAFRSSLPLWLF